MNLDSFVEDLVTRARGAARTLPSCTMSHQVEAVPGRFDAWSVMLDVFRHGDVEHWAMSIKLMTPSSTRENWTISGEIVAAVIDATGYPRSAPYVAPIMPIREAHPTALLWWMWHSDGSAIDENAASVFKKVISAMTPRDPRWKGTRV